MMRLLLFIPPVILSACTSVQPQPAPPPPQQPQAALVSDAPASNNCGNLLDDYETFSLMDSKGRRQFLDNASSNWVLTRGGCEQLRLALLLSQPNRPDKDRRRALQLLKELLDDEKLPDAQAHQLASLLHDQLRQIHSQQLKTLDLRRRLKAQNTASRQLAEQLSKLQFQLQQLKTIEQNINEKEQSIITPSTGNISNQPP
ncbi:hypothetical protein [Thiolapillus sp.]